jgi:hypothetical protein
LRSLFVFVFLMAAIPTFAQQSPSPTQQDDAVSTTVTSPTTEANQTAALDLPDAPAPQQTDAATASSSTPPAELPKPAPQPKRILGIMPNYRAVSAGVRPPPPTPREAFTVATKNSFDYSAFIFVGVTSLLAEGTNAHPQIGKGVDGFWGYYWRGYLDKTDGNYMVDFVMPTIFHQDERYYAMGRGGILKRGVYAATRILITPDYHGRNSFNASEVLGRGVSQAISLSYYPSSDQTGGAFAQKYAYAMGRDALTNVFREFWPDIATHALHRHP